MATRHISMRGEVIDMNRLRTVNAETVALGNANLNARGDIIGKGGIVLKTQEQIEAEWEANRVAREESVKKADIKADALIPDVVPQRKVEKKLEVDDQDFNPSTGNAKTSRRKITESDT
jgi:hypothetical protein